MYAEKRQRYLQEIVAWLRKHMGDAVTVAYHGEVKPLASWLAGAQGPRSTVKEQIDTIAASVLAPHFEDRYPGYPPFGVQVTANLAETVKQALVQVVTGRPNALGGKVLAALNLVDVLGNLVDDGPFASHLIDQITAGGGRAVNRGELFVDRDPDVLIWGPWHLEPAWFVVVAAGLHAARQARSRFQRRTDGPRFGLEKLARMGLDDLEAVTHVAPPKELPLIVLKEAVKLIDLPPGSVSATGASEALVQSVATNCITYADRIVRARTVLGDGINLWGAQVVENQTERTVALRAFDDVVSNLRAAKHRRQAEQARPDEGADHQGQRRQIELAWAEAAVAASTHLADVVAYLREAVEVFGASDPISIDAANLRAELLELFRSGSPTDAGRVASLRAQGEDLRRRFADAALSAHQRDRLDGAGDERKRRVCSKGLRMQILDAFQRSSCYQAGNTPVCNRS